MSRTGILIAALSLISLTFTSASAKQTGKDQVISKPCKWVPIVADTLPDREHFSAGGHQFFSKPDTDSGAKHKMAVVGEVHSQSLRREIFHILLDCDENMDPQKELLISFDFTCSKDFNNAQRLPLVFKGEDKNSFNYKTYHMDYAVVDAVVNGEKRPLGIKLQYWQSSSRYIWCTIGTALQGNITLDGKEYIIQFCDGNGNLQCTDKTTSDQKTSKRRLADMVRLFDPETGDPQRPAALGLYGEDMVVGDSVYKFELDSDNCVRAAKQDIPLATVDMPYEYSRISLLKQGPQPEIFYIQGNAGKLKLPAGDYKLYSAVFFKEVEKVVSCLVTRPPINLSIEAGQQVDLDLSQCFKLKFACKLQGRTLKVQQSRDILGIWYNGAKQGAAGGQVLECVDTEGNVFASYEVKDGNSSFILPPNFPYQFKVRMIWPDTVFYFTSDEVEIDVDQQKNTEVFSL